ncbi:MAG: hypothetical protein K6U08_05220, partial [Firmicutes bacterium]|nr:hypothetical protein [Bacillota bacterium]
EALASLVPTPVVLCLQNGVGSEEEVGRRLGRERVAAGVFTLSVERPSPGCVLVATGQGGIALGPVPGTLGPDLAGTLKATGFRVRTYPRADAVKWSKLLLNLWANALSAVSGLPPRELVGAAPLFHLDWLAFREALKVMRALRIPVVDLPGYPVRLLVRLHRVLPEAAFRRLVGPKVAGGRGGKLPSLWLDLSAGRRVTEVRWLNGAVVEAGRLAGVATPVNQALVRALEAAAGGVGSPSGRLDGLLRLAGGRP